MQNLRRERIRDYIEQHGEATVAELTALCDGCSGMTLWRDLNRLEQEGAIRRTRGGAISMRLIQPDVEGLYSQRAKENTDAKRRIAKAAAQFILPGHALFLDAGSTLMEVAKSMPDQRYTIITSGANIAIELSQRRFPSVLCVGGQISGNTLSCSGPQAEAFLDGLNIDIALMATSGFSLNGGFSSGNFGECQLKAKVMGKAAKTIMLMDDAKLGRVLPFTFATLEDVDVIVVDAPLDAGTAAAVKEAGVTLIIANE